jgi:hypothetical protein
LPYEQLCSEVGEPIVYLMATADQIGNPCNVGGAKVQCACAQGEVECDDITAECKDVCDGTYELHWCSTRPGTFEVSVKIDGEHVVNSPSSVRFVSTRPVCELSVVMPGPGLQTAVVGERSSIVVSLNDQYGNETVPGPDYRATFRVYVAFVKVGLANSLNDDASDAPQVEAEGRWVTPSGGLYELFYTPASVNMGFTELFVWCDPHGTGERTPLPGSPFKLSISASLDQVVSNEVDTTGSVSGDYRVVRSVFENAQERWGTCTLDAFASEPTAVCERFWTAAYCENACGTDALRQLWARGERVWAHPPTELLTKLAKLLGDPTRHSEVIVCAPFWPSSKWFRAIEALADDQIKHRAGKLQKLPGVTDAPGRLGTWPIILFHVPAPPALPTRAAEEAVARAAEDARARAEADAKAATVVQSAARRRSASRRSLELRQAKTTKAGAKAATVVQAAARRRSASRRSLLLREAKAAKVA